MDGLILDEAFEQPTKLAVKINFLQHEKDNLEETVREMSDNIKVYKRIIEQLTEAAQTKVENADGVVSNPDEEPKDLQTLCLSVRGLIYVFTCLYSKHKFRNPQHQPRDRPRPYAAATKMRHFETASRPMRRGIKQ